MDCHLHVGFLPNWELAELGIAVCDRLARRCVLLNIHFGASCFQEIPSLRGVSEDDLAFYSVLPVALQSIRKEGENANQAIW